jgi:hypothetical protein
MKPLSFAERAHRLAEAERLQYTKARILLEELEEQKDGAESYLENDPSEILEELTQAVDMLTSLVNLGMVFAAGDFEDATTSITGLNETLPSTEQMQAFVDAYTRLEEALDEMQEQRDDPSSYDKDDRDGARDEARSALEGVAEALDELDAPGNA